MIPWVYPITLSTIAAALRRGVKVLLRPWAAPPPPPPRSTWYVYLSEYRPCLAPEDLGKLSFPPPAKRLTTRAYYPYLTHKESNARR